ncbi:hypothetical protein PGH47_42285 (plasmid) [Streptomyces sp. HUAS 31]|uniref:hypothetical protein n=1 Tax=Streptomyces TaxID=1883 RepID=UPI0023060D6E|nr:hypothetical protein [Streptomyces sp. HUAS 31]WCE02383.1 hypothetical protein PGH47_42285 [Streptomyces sp. HUAS 31]
MSITRKVVAGSAAAAALWAGIAVSADAATRDGSDAKVISCPWTANESWGSAEGCTNTSKVEGWVKDLKADGYCVQFVIHWKGPNGKSDWDYSPKACPKGEKQEFTKMPGDGTHWRATSWDMSVKRV